MPFWQAFICIESTWLKALGLPGAFACELFYRTQTAFEWPSAGLNMSRCHTHIQINRGLPISGALPDLMFCAVRGWNMNRRDDL